jgi:hypothetical protein
VQHAAISHHQSATGHGNQFTKRGDPILQRHEGAQVCIAPKRPCI